MIKLIASQGVIKDTKLNYETLGNICTQIFRSGFGKDLKLKCIIHKSRTADLSCIEKISRGKYKISLDTKGDTDKKYYIGTILHELRHAIQDEIFKFRVIAKFSTYNAYYNSLEEKDARKQERLTTEVMKIYDNYEKAQEKFVKFNLKELG